MANFFDQYDSKSEASGNYFDKFDSPETISKQEFGPAQSAITESFGDNVSPAGIKDSDVPGLNAIRQFFVPEGAGSLNRIQYSLKSTPKDRVNFLREKFGHENVRLSQEGGPGIPGRAPGSENYGFLGDPKLVPQVRENGKGWYTFGGDRFSISDVGGAAVPIADVAAHVGVGLLPGGATPAAQGLTTAITSSAKKIAGQLLPGGTEQTPLQVGEDIAVESGLTAASQFGVNKFFDAVDYLRPKNYVAREYQKAKETRIGYKGERLSGRNPNVVMTPGQETQDPMLMGIDEAGKKSIFASRKAATFYDNQVTESVKSAKKALGIIDDTGLDNIGRGKMFEAMTNKSISHGYSAREANAAKNYAFVKDAPDAPVKASNLSAELDDISKSYAGLRTAIKKGESVLSDFFDEAGNVVNSVGLKKAIDNRRVFSNIARGKGTVYPSLSDQGMNREIGKRLVAAIERDIDEAGSSVGGEFGKKLAAANKQYAMDSQAIRGIKDTVFGRLIGTNKTPTPEDFVAALKQAKGTKMDALFDMAKNHEPQFYTAAKGAIVEDMLTAARKSPGTPSHQTMDFDPYKYVETSYGWDRSALSKLFQSSDERLAFIDTISLMKRIRGNEAMGGGQPATQAMKEGAMVAVGQSPIFAVSWFTKWIVSPAVSRAIFDPTKKGQAALRTITHTKQGTKAFTNAMNYLAGLSAKESDIESDVTKSAKESGIPVLEQ